jgi:hypothetical protein
MRIGPFWALFLTCAVFAYGFAHARPTEDMPIVKLRSLDKTSARTSVFEAAVGSTIKFGEVFIKVQACRKAPEMEQPEAAAFLQVWQVDRKDDAEWIFSGWMFSSSPGLSAMDHPIYDVWVLDCMEKKTTDPDKASEDKAQAPEPEKAAEPAAPVSSTEEEIVQPD